MEILFVYAPYMFRHQGFFEKGKQFDFGRLYDDKSGLTGSELSCFTFAHKFAQRGHNVSILTTTCNNPGEWNGVRIISMNKREDIGVLGGPWDVVYSWNDIDTLRFASHPKTLKILNMQINDVDHGFDGYDNYIDIYTSPSHSHRDRMSKKTPDPNKWEVVYNGCDPSIYDHIRNLGVQEVSGRVIYASSPDRGLHWLLQIWPKIQKAVPHAHLKIFYEVDKWMGGLVNQIPSPNVDIAILSARARYIREALLRLKDHNIELVGSVSRSEIAKEFVEAQVLAYPCDTINYTEGFSVTLMEACASGTVPVTSDVDALSELYGSSVPMVHSPVGNNLDTYTNLVIRSLTDPGFRNDVLAKTSKLAAQFSWDKLTDGFLDILEARGFH